MSFPHLKVAVVGAGISDQPGEHKRFAVVAHLPALKALPNLYEIAATCTTRLATAEAAARKFGIPHYFDDVEKMLAALPDIDVVCVAVRPALQFEIVMTALKAGKHVYCEHPLGTKTAEALAMCRLAKEKGVRTVVGHQQHYEPGMLQLAEMIREKKIGEVLSFNISYVSDGSIVEQDRDWLASGDADIRPTWRSGHTLERLISAFGEVGSVCADLSRRGGTDNVDNLNVLLRMKSGAPGTMHLCQAAWFKLGWALTVYGSRGMLMLRSESPKHHRHLILEGGGVDSLDQGRPKLATITPDPKFQFVTTLDEKTPPYSVAQTWHALAKAIHRGHECSPNFAEEAGLHKVLDAIEESIKQKAWVDVGEQD